MSNTSLTLASPSTSPIERPAAEELGFTIALRTLNRFMTDYPSESGADEDECDGPRWLYHKSRNMLLDELTEFHEQLERFEQVTTK